MLLTTSNILLGVTPTVTFGNNVNGNPANITDPDFSKNYTSVSKGSLTMEFGATSEINYVAVAGITCATTGNGSVSVSNGATPVISTFIVRNNCVLLSFPAQTFSDLRVSTVNNNIDLEPTISFVAAGVTLTVPNGGEVAGYARQWLNRPTKTKTTSNQIGAPVALLRKRVPVKGTLTLPNMTASFSQNEYQDFLDFAFTDVFFINEDPLIPISSYCCYEITTRPPTAHSQTRSLNNLSFSFKAFNGL